MGGTNQVALHLTRAEALVFFEWLARVDSADARLRVDQAEQHVLWTLEGQLEKALTEPLQANYQELLEEARREVRERHGT